MKQQKALTLKTLTKSNVWDLQENDILHMWESAERDADLKDNMRHYIDVIRSAFDMEEVKIAKPEVISKYEARGYKIGTIRLDENNKAKWAIKKRPIARVTDLTYENIHHITAEKLLEVIDSNFGGGWESLSQSIRDIIESGFDISTTTLPKTRLHKPGGMYEKKVNDGYEVLEIEKGMWVEAIFAKEKPESEPYMPLKDSENNKYRGLDDDDDDYDDRRRSRYDDDDDYDEDKDDKYDDDDDDAFDEDKLTEESYRTTFETDPEELTLEAEDVTDDDNY